MLDDRGHRHLAMTPLDAAPAPPSPLHGANCAVAPAGVGAPQLGGLEAQRPRTFALLSAAEDDAQLAAQLMAMSACERQAAALHEPRYQRPSLASFLALRAESELFDLATDPRPTAELAAAVAQAMPRDGAGKARRAAALAHWLFGKALLAAQQWRLADHSFQCMFAFIPASGPSEEAALAAVGQAQVLADTGALDSAIGQFLLAAYRFSQLGAAQAVAACQAELGLLLLDSGDLLSARLSLSPALALLDPCAAPSLAARLRLALAEVATVVAGPAAGAEDLRRARALYDLAPLAPDGAAGPEALERRWREARIAAAAGDALGAATLLDAVRRELLLRGSPTEAARCTFDRLLLCIDARSFAEVTDLTGALARAFPGVGEQWARDMKQLAALAADHADSVYAPCWDLRRRLRQVTPLDPLRPPLLRPARLLSDRVLRRRGELEDPIGAAGAQALPSTFPREIP